MGRTPGNADRLLIAAAKEIASQEGCTGIRIREVAERAGVNLGMFHYHFRSKKRFERIVMQEMYEEFFAKLSVASRDGKEAVDQLRNTLLAIGFFVRDNRHFFAAMLKDVLNEEQQVLDFVRENLPRHLFVLRRLIKRCQEDGSIAALPLPQVMAFLGASLNMPTVIAGIVERRGRSGLPKVIATDGAISQRVELALKGLRP